MTSIAFLGTAAVKEQALARLRSHLNNGTFRYGAPWGDDGASAMGSVIEGNDAQAYADLTGFPLALAMVLDKIVLEIRDEDQSKAFAVDWLERTPVGADLSRIPGNCIVHLLVEEIIVEIAQRDPETEKARRAVLALHRRALDGDIPTRREWKSIRTSAISASDAVSDAELCRVSRMIESAAWPTTMGTVLSDTLSARNGLDIEFAFRRVGWTEDDESEVFRRLEAAEEVGRVIRGVPAAYAFLSESDPGFAQRFQARIDAFPLFTASSRSMGEFILELLSTAPIADAVAETA
jgi:hypothetical protein